MDLDFSELNGDGLGVEVPELIARIKEISPQDLAEALCLLESHQKLTEFGCFSAPLACDETKVFFSRGLKNEVEEIYLELARHLRGKSEGSLDLMNTVFDFLTDTLRSLINIPYLISSN